MHHPPIVAKIKGVNLIASRSTISRTSSIMATSWPRIEGEDKPSPLPWSELLFERAVSIIRPPLQLVLVIQILHPLFVAFATHAKTSLGLSEPAFFALMTCLSHHTMYLLVNGFYTIVEHYELFEEYRLWTRPAQRPSSALRWDAVKGSALATPIILVSAYFGHRVFSYFGMPDSTAPLRTSMLGIEFGSSSLALFVYFNVIKFCTTLGFDTVHRIIHGARFYKRIHAHHHKFVSTISVAAEYAHPIEGASQVLFPVLLAQHQLAFFLFIAWEQLNAGMTHSGYSFYVFKEKWHKIVGIGFNADESVYHFYHHLYYNKGNFSSMLMDHLYGTHDYWLKDGRTAGVIAKLKREKRAYQEKQLEKLKATRS